MECNYIKFVEILIPALLFILDFVTHSGCSVLYIPLFRNAANANPLWATRSWSMLKTLARLKFAVAHHASSTHLLFCKSNLDGLTFSVREERSLSLWDTDLISTGIVVAIKTVQIATSSPPPTGLNCGVETS